MAKITQDAVHTLSLEDAVSLIKNADGRVRFSLRVSAFMPTTEDGQRGFEGSTFVHVSRADLLKALPEMLSKPFAEKGAKLRVTVTAPTYERGLAFISVY